MLSNDPTNNNSLPDFSPYGYQLQKLLGSNPLAGRNTYLAQKMPDVTSQNITSPNIPNSTNQTNPKLVVLKQLQFAQGNAQGGDWAGFEQYQREVELLKALDHPGIPKYLDFLETSNGFCIVQEYKPAQPLTSKILWTPEAVIHVARSVLQILQYLQTSFTQPVLHRDIKPENILIDDKQTVYLIDFGLARIGTGTATGMSIAAGTLGFMAPEQLYNRPLSEATDLYGLGMTLICLVTGTRSLDVGNLVSDDGKIQLQKIAPKLAAPLRQWLEKMVQTNPKDRFPNGKAALEALTTVEKSLLNSEDGSNNFSNNFNLFTAKPTSSAPIAPKTNSDLDWSRFGKLTTKNLTFQVRFQAIGTQRTAIIPWDRINNIRFEIRRNSTAGAIWSILGVVILRQNIIGLPLLLVGLGYLWGLPVVTISTNGKTRPFANLLGNIFNNLSGSLPGQKEFGFDEYARDLPSVGFPWQAPEAEAFVQAVLAKKNTLDKKNSSK